MRLKSVRVQNYRSIRDTGEQPIEIEHGKTILVGPNEAGKSAILTAIQQLNPPTGVKGFDALRDYPRALYNDITTGKVVPSKTRVVTGVFSLDDDDRAALPEGFKEVEYEFTRYLDNRGTHSLRNGPSLPTLGSLRKDLLRLAAHAKSRVPAPAEGETAQPSPEETLAAATKGWLESSVISGDLSKVLKTWLDEIAVIMDPNDEEQEKRHVSLWEACGVAGKKATALETLEERLPTIVLFSNYFRVRPEIQLAHLAERLETHSLDDDAYDYGNVCLLKLLGFTARELSDLGRVDEPQPSDKKAVEANRDKLDKRKYQLNSASVRLTGEIKDVWNPDSSRGEADRLRVGADGQYLKVTVEDELGVEIELHQRSEGFQWLVSFFVVFFAEAAGKHANAILLLDEPGISLHALKQREFRTTISRLAAKNQTIYTTHSPFLVGPGELDIVRVVELTDRTIGTKVHTTVASGDSAALLPLQEALGYDLAQSLFAQERNLVLEGLTDHWYLEAVAALLTEAGEAKLNPKIALVTASTAGKVVYFATILHAHSLKVAALLDSDAAGDQAAQQDTLVHRLGNKRILRTKDYITGVAKAEIEDLLRDTLPIVARDKLGWDVIDLVAQRPGQPLVDIFAGAVTDFSKYKLAKAFVRWSRDNDASALSDSERTNWSKLVTAINAALK
ncbi:AAA family ATPase [Hansschlegelia plantiphila]|uniref:OLD family endonuclease n=1 Tax=Hansschlegelia plantiphila TaxID=374655 RepID=A0A9W6IZQ4_9HYPH|nr:AAA family ATPase [Hansschlegelia plantiphila]GLK66644.1 hypothetical protein GCM10008179_02820 [Hansschlegelia plantiphila]